MCIFCRIVEHELPASIVYEDEHAIAFLDIQPINPGHVLVIPKEHTKSLKDLSTENAGHIMRVGMIVSQALRASELPCEGVNLFLADGKAAGQEVDHVHLHVFPRYKGDGVELKYDQSNRKPPGRKQLDENANEIKKALDKIKLLMSNFSTNWSCDAKLMVYLYYSNHSTVFLHTLGNTTPSDFSLVLSWNTGSLPPEYTYSYEIKIGPDLQGTLEYQFGYDTTESTHKYLEEFQITQDQIDSLYLNLKDQGMFQDDWSRGETTEGGPGSSLMLSTNDENYYLPSLSELAGENLVRMEASIDTIRNLVPIELWQDLQARKNIYEAEYEYDPSKIGKLQYITG